MPPEQFDRDSYVFSAPGTAVMSLVLDDWIAVMLIVVAMKRFWFDFRRLSHRFLNQSSPESMLSPS
jgi:hypothetical protein